MKKLIILMLLIFVSCSGNNSNSSVPESTRTTSLMYKQQTYCSGWVNSTSENLTEVNNQLEIWFSAVGQVDLTSSWFEEFRKEDEVSNAITLQKEINNQYGEIMLAKQKGDVGTILRRYVEAFDYWEQGVLEDNLTVFNEGTRRYKQAEKILDKYKKKSINTSNEEYYYYDFRPYCKISAPGGQY
jgi:hypothetical protein